MQASGLLPKKQVAYFEYDFTKHGGAVGNISVPGDAIPAGAIITSGIIHVKTALTSGGAATIAAQAVGAADLRAATAVASWSLNAMLDVVPQGLAAAMIRLASPLTALTFVVAAAALTAGKAVVALEYFVTTN
jgi:hypothetical protein